MLTKLHSQHLKDTETKAPQPVEAPPARKPNFFDRKRFVDYERNEDSDQEKSKEALPPAAEAKEVPKKAETEEAEDWDLEEKRSKKSEEDWDMSDHDL